jgi:hypothetical protein
MVDWIRLTPETQDVDPDNVAEYRYVPTEFYCHEIRVSDPCPNPPSPLSDAELAALPPVKARDERIARLEGIVSRVSEMLPGTIHNCHFCGPDDLCAWHGELTDELAALETAE